MNNKTITRGGIQLYGEKAAIKKLNEAEKKGYILYGIDGFFIGEDYTQPSMENSIDYSSRNAKVNIFNSTNPEIYNLARGFIRSNALLLPNLYFEIVTNEK